MPSTLAHLEQDFEDLFDLAPISLWLEDYSPVKTALETLKAQGVTDLQAYFDQYPLAVVEYSEMIQVRAVNQKTLSMFGAKDLNQLRHSLNTLFREEKRQALEFEFISLWSGETRFTSQTISYSVDNRRMDVIIRGHVMPGHEHDWSRVLISVEDITERERLDAMRLRSEQYARGLFEHSPVSLWVEDFSFVKKMLDRLPPSNQDTLVDYVHAHPKFAQDCIDSIRILDINRQTLKLFKARSKSELVHNMDKVLESNAIQNMAERLALLKQGQLTQSKEMSLTTITGEQIHGFWQFAILPGYEADWGLALVSFTDITERKKAEAHLDYVSSHDILTQIYNRSYHERALAKIVDDKQYPIGLMYFDLNGLKACNDVHGHTAGDLLLQRAGHLLQQVAGDEGYVARMGGDEFIMVFARCDDAALRGHVLNYGRQLAQINRRLAGELMSFALGTAVVNEGHSIEEGFKLADARMYENKRSYYLKNDQRHIMKKTTLVRRGTEFGKAGIKKLSDKLKRIFTRS